MHCSDIGSHFYPVYVNEAAVCTRSRANCTDCSTKLVPSQYMLADYWQELIQTSLPMWLLGFTHSFCVITQKSVSLPLNVMWRSGSLQQLQFNKVASSTTRTNFTWVFSPLFRNKVSEDYRCRHCCLLLLASRNNQMHAATELHVISFIDRSTCI